MDYFFTLIIFKLKYLFRILVFPIKIEIINKMIVLNTNVEQLIKTFVLILITLYIIEKSMTCRIYTQKVAFESIVILLNNFLSIEICIA